MGKSDGYKIGIACPVFIAMVNDKVSERKKAIEPQVPVGNLFSEIHPGDHS